MGGRWPVLHLHEAEALVEKGREERAEWVRQQLREGRSQSDVAREAGITRQAVSQIAARMKEGRT